MFFALICCTLPPSAISRPKSGRSWCYLKNYLITFSIEIGALTFACKARYLQYIAQSAAPPCSEPNMHDDYMDSMTIKVEHPYSDVHREDQFGDGHLVGIVGDHSPNLSPHSEYNGLGFLPPGHMSVDPMYSRPPPAYYSPPQPLHPINTATLWPSQITNPSETVPIVAVAMHRPIAPLSRGSPAPTPAPVASSGPTMSSSRRTLTDNDRRRMCKYHEENPNVKQTEIGRKSLPQD